MYIKDYRKPPGALSMYEILKISRSHKTECRFYSVVAFNLIKHSPGSVFILALLCCAFADGFFLSLFFAKSRWRQFSSTYYTYYAYGLNIIQRKFIYHRALLISLYILEFTYTVCNAQCMPQMKWEIFHACVCVCVFIAFYSVALSKRARMLALHTIAKERKRREMLMCKGFTHCNDLKSVYHCNSAGLTNCMG